jgi:hypothetical protein
MAGIERTDPTNWLKIGILADQVVRPK